ncbi:MAG: BACON domain-containing protein [Bryobacterales bacterium]|nr:BACON domain-containing protein [Bryobacterales bacterium]
MNSRGAVVITATVPDSSGGSNYRPLLWTPSVDNGTTGTTQLLPIPAGFSSVSPLYLNNRNEIVGLAYSPNRNGPVPFVFTQGKMFAIEGVPGVTGGGWPHAFNDAGQLLLSSSQAGVLYLLTPQAGTGTCPVTTSLLQETVGPAGGRVNIAIASAASCTWSAAVSDPWLVPNGSTTGTGNGTLTVDVPANSTGAARTGYVTINGTTFTIRQSLLPVVSFYPSSLRIVIGANGVTGPQDVQIRTSGTGVVTGSAYTIYPPELKVTLAQASLPGSMTVSYTKGATAPLSGVYQVTVGLNGADQTSLSLPVTIEVQPAGTATKPPFGSLDTPVVNAGALSGGVAVTGWAMDDIGVEKVEIWRDRVGKEQVYPNGKVYIGVGTFVQDARSDIEGLFPTLPQNRRAGWGYMMLSNVLPNPGGAPGNGTYTLEAIAVDREGNSASLGRRVITVNNAASKKPFGALDAPGAGATVSGSAYSTSGWVLTPRPAMIPRDGHTIGLFIDGVPQGTVSYNQLRTDVAGYFPNNINSDGAGGSLTIDTTKLSNGMHTIYWVAIDDQGNADGIGSRFFNTLNAGAAVAAEPEAPRTEAATMMDGDRLETKPLGRVEFQMAGGGTDAEWEGALVVDGEKRPLPVGSTLNGRYGRFYWHVPPGFRGDFELQFTDRATGAMQRVTVGVGRPGLEREER